MLSFRVAHRAHQKGLGNKTRQNKAHRQTDTHIWTKSYSWFWLDKGSGTRTRTRSSSWEQRLQQPSARRWSFKKSLLPQKKRKIGGSSKQHETMKLMATYRTPLYTFHHPIERSGYLVDSLSNVMEPHPVFPSTSPPTPLCFFSLSHMHVSRSFLLN